MFFFYGCVLVFLLSILRSDFSGLRGAHVQPQRARALRAGPLDAGSSAAAGWGNGWRQHQRTVNRCKHPGLQHVHVMLPYRRIVYAVLFYA